MKYDSIRELKEGCKNDSIIYDDLYGGNMIMTDKQMQFIAWLVTTLTDKCQTIEEVRALNEEIRKNSAGLLVKEEEKASN